MPLSIVGISGSLRRPSRTSGLVRAILAALHRRLGAAESDLIELADAAGPLFSAHSRAAASVTAEAILCSVETADLLIVGTPVYRASYTGALKHLFDLVRHDALAGTPVVLAATGGSPLHGLVTEHQLRPLLSFFGALTLPIAIYATEADFDGETLINPAVAERIGRTADDAIRLLDASHLDTRHAARRERLAQPA